jgi:hypothetical protein
VTITAPRAYARLVCSGASPQRTAGAAALLLRSGIAASGATSSGARDDTAIMTVAMAVSAAISLVSDLRHHNLGGGGVKTRKHAAAAPTAAPAAGLGSRLLQRDECSSAALHAPVLHTGRLGCATSRCHGLVQAVLGSATNQCMRLLPATLSTPTAAVTLHGYCSYTETVKERRMSAAERANHCCSWVGVRRRCFGLRRRFRKADSSQQQ